MNEVSRISRLTVLEVQIEDALAKMVDGWNESRECLLIIKEEELWKESGCDSFVDYGQKRWDLGKSQLYRLCEAQATRKLLLDSPMGEKAPKKERQLREVAKAPKKDQVEVAQKAVEKAESEGREPTVQDFKESRQSVTETQEKIQAAGQMVPTSFSVFEKAYKEHIGPLVRALDRVKNLNGGQGEHYVAANAALLRFVEEFKKMGKGEL